MHLTSGHRLIQCRPLSRSAGFSLLELLLVIAIITVLTVFSGPAISSLSGAGSVNKTIGDLTGTVELARTYAMTHHTYVRIALGNSTVSGVNQTVVLCLYSANGSTTADVANTTSWPLMSKPLLLNKFVVTDSLNSSQPDTSLDVVPSQTTYSTISRTVPGMGSVSFTSFIEFNPSGEASVTSDGPARFIKIGMDKASPENGKNPFILRFSGITGTINVLRKESL